MWVVLESSSAEKALDRLPIELKRKYEVWKSIVQHSGPTGLRTVKGFHDEAFAGTWKGHRSSRLNHAYRVIYRVAGAVLEVHVVDVNKHDYRRR
jgi:addiction module RelE/StbE family toxin